MRAWSNRWTVTLLSLLACLLLLEVVAGVLHAPSLLWNEVRICRSAALLRGVSLYPPKDAPGPIIGTLHTPVSHCFYLAAAWLRTPAALILAGSALSVLVVFLALGWCLLRSDVSGARNWNGTTVAFLFCGFLILQTPGTYNTVFMIHTDAPALALATVACGILSKRNTALTRVQVWIAGAACSLVIACKQTLAPVSLGVLIFIFIVGTWRDVIRFLAAMLLTAAAVLEAVSAFVPISAFLFNTVHLAASRPLKIGYIAILADAFRLGKLEALPALFPVVLLLTRGRLRQVVRDNRWLVFVVVGLILVPVCVKAMITVGSDLNHVGLVLYFLFAGAALAIQQNLSAPDVFPRITARVCAGMGILVSLAPGALLSLPGAVSSLTRNASELAFHYSVQHGTQTYFPLNPAAAFLAHGKLYHFDGALYDREIAGAALTAEQIKSGLPDGFDRIAVPPGELITSAAIKGLMAGWIPASDSDLPGWTVLKRK